MNYIQVYDTYKNAVENALRASLSGDGKSHARLIEAMCYSLLAGGKRVRPVMTLAFSHASGGDFMDAMPAALAVEMLHTYSLIHDDLPCMDNDGLRRGKPTNHIVYGEMLAMLAGDALQSRAFYEILNSDLPDSVKSACALKLATAAGEEGMCAGQYLDMTGEGRSLTEDELTAVHSLKTAALIEAACVMGVIAAGGTAAQTESAALYARKVGLAFQIRDDMLDKTSNTEELGKPAGSDERGQKSTFMTLYGMRRCAQLVDDLTSEAGEALSGVFRKTEFLLELAEMLSGRPS